jgi:selenocysteine lyase/cysteine desulfurase
MYREFLETVPVSSVGIDVAAARADTPGAEHVVHLNNAGAALPPAPVLDAVIGHLQREAMVGGYEAEDAAHEQLEAVYAQVADLVGGAPDEIALVENATRGWDLVFYGLGLTEGDRVLTARSEYASSAIAFLQLARQRGIEITVLPDDPSGQVDLDALRRELGRDVRLVALPHVPTQGGLVNPAAEVGALVRGRSDAFYLLDTVQSVGQLPLDVAALGCHALVGTGRKWLRGPRGTGFVWLAGDATERVDPPFLDLRAAQWTGPDTYDVRPDARRLETWESYVAGRLGLGAAVAYATRIGLPAIAGRVAVLAQRMRGGLAELPGVVVHDLGRATCGLVTFTTQDLPAPVVAEALRERGVNVSVSSRSSALWDFDRRGLDTVVRASPHYYNTEDEVDALVAAVRELRLQPR